jgi:hypothetical protein
MQGIGPRPKNAGGRKYKVHEVIDKLAVPWIAGRFSLFR